MMLKSDSSKSVFSLGLWVALAAPWAALASEGASVREEPLTVEQVQVPIQDKVQESTPPGLPGLAEEQALVKPAVEAVVSLMNQSAAAGSGAPVIEERHVGDALVAMLRKGRSLGLHFSGFTIGKFKGGTAGISGQIGKELVFAPDAKDPRVWKVSVYSVSSFGVGLAAQAGLGYSVGIIFDMKNLDDYKSGFCAVTGLFGNIVDFGVSFRIGCGLTDFAKLARSLVSHPVTGDASETQEKIVQVSNVPATEKDQSAFFEKLQMGFADDGRPKVISGSIALGASLPMGLILSFQPHRQTQKPKELSLDGIQQLITDEFL